LFHFSAPATSLHKAPHVVALCVPCMRPILPVRHTASGGEITWEQGCARLTFRPNWRSCTLVSFPDHIPPQLEVLYTSLIPRSHSTSTGSPVHVSFPDHIPPQLEVLYTSLIPRPHSASTGGPVH